MTKRREQRVMGSNVNRGLSQSKYTQSWQTTLRQTVETSFLRGTKLSSDSYSRRSKEEPLLACQTQSDKGISSTWASRKKRRCRGSHLFKSIRAWLGPQTLGMEVKPCMSKTPKGMSRSASCSNHIWIAPLTTKAATGKSASKARVPTRQECQQCKPRPTLLADGWMICSPCRSTPISLAMKRLEGSWFPNSQCTTKWATHLTTSCTLGSSWPST